MLKKYRNILKDNKTLIHNFSYLSFLQVFNLILPLITYPYLIRVIGKELYGLIIYAMAISFFFSILIDFGFNITATKQISINRNNSSKLSEIICSVLFIKIILGLISLSILILVISIVPSFSEYKLLYLFSFLICLNDVFFSQWFFQGIEQMKYITIISVISRLCFVFLILFFVKSESDYLLVPLLGGLGAFINGFVSMYIIFVVKKVKFFFPKKENLLFYFQEALPLFWSRLISKVKDQSNTVFIGSSIGMVEVAYYDLAMKLVNIANSFIETITIAIFPKLSHSGNKNVTRKFFMLTFLCALLGYFSFVLFGKYIVFILGGEKMLNAVNLLPLVGLFLLRSSSFFIGNIVLVINNKIKPYVNSLYISGGSYFLLIGLGFILKINFTIELFILIALFSLLLEYGYRVYACKKYNLLDNLIEIKKNDE